ncbi:MAG: biopolymer transporter ExbD, partial [Flavobacteriales bacterium]|nr:biopolymer transporter ExbD [Flavobacteriales bacterium]
MKRRTTPNISAGSMADIAFLLLIFFLVATTVDKPVGFLKTLPPIVEVPPAEVEKNNMLHLLVGNDKILFNNEEVDLKRVQELTKAFYTNGGVFHTTSPEQGIPIRSQRLAHLANGQSYQPLGEKTFIMCEYMSDVKYQRLLDVKNAVHDGMMDSRQETLSKWGDYDWD